MIYRLNRGADSEIKKRFVTAGLVLALTIGLPVAGALITRENLTPDPTSVAQDDNPGAVLGDATQNQPDSSSSNTNANAVPPNQPVASARPLPVQTMQRSAPLTVSAAPAQPVPNEEPTPPVGGSGGQPPDVTITPEPSDNPNDPGNTGISVGIEAGPVQLEAHLQLEDESELNL